VILCHITSQAREEEYAISLAASDRAVQVTGSKLTESRQPLIQILTVR